MVANLTPWLSLTKPQVNGPETENQWGYDLNVNFDVLDSAVGPALSHLDAVQVDLDAIYDALDTKAPIASPALTGNPTAPTPPAGDADTSIATTAFVKNALTVQGAIFPSNAAPVMDGVAAPGTSVLYSREDHKHPVDTSRAPINSPDFVGNPTAPTPAASTNSGILATTKFVKDQGYVTAAYVDAKPAGTTISDTPPAAPTQGQTWWESDTGKYFINYNDGNTTQWVHINGPLANVYAKNETYSRPEADANFVDVAGDTMTGDLFISKTAAHAYMTLSSTPPNVAQYRIQIGGSNRWAFGTAGVAETGGNAGSNFGFYRFSDTGVYLDTPLNISRADGAVVLASTVASTSPTTGALTVAGGLGVAGALYGTFAQFARSGAVGAMLQARDNDATATNQFALLCVRNGSAVGGLQTTNVATSLVTSSDVRLKEDLQSFDAGRIIDQTEVYDFKWKEADERSYGIVAQQAVEVYPQAITHIENDEVGDWWGVDYSKYVPVILQELKALRARVAELEGEKAPIASKKGH